jgi:hypothetical protein
VTERRFGPDGAALLAWLRSLNDAAARRIEVRNDTLESVIVSLMTEEAARA